MSESDRDWQIVQDAFERALRRRMLAVGRSEHAECAFSRIVIEGDEVRAYCEHGDPLEMPERSQVWG